MFDTAPVQALAAAITVSLVFPLHGDVAARAEIIGAFSAECASIKDVLSDLHRSPIG